MLWLPSATGSPSQSLQAMQWVRLVFGAGTLVYLACQSLSCVAKLFSRLAGVKSAQPVETWRPTSKPCWS